MRKPRSPTQRSLFDYVQHAKPGTPSVGTATKQAGAGHLARSAAGTPTGAKPPGAAGGVLASPQAHIAAGRAASLESPTGRAPTGLMQQPSFRGDGLGTPHSHARGGAVAVGGQMPALGHAGSSAASIATSPSTTHAAGSKAAYVMGLLSPAAREVRRWRKRTGERERGFMSCQAGHLLGGC